MNLTTPTIIHQFRKHPFCSQEGLGTKAKVILKVFNPYGVGTWLITEAEKQDDGDWLLFGYCHLFEWEWGYVSLNELQSIRPVPSTPELTLEREVHESSMRYTVEELAS